MYSLYLATNQGVGSSNLSERAKFKASSDGGLSFWIIQRGLDNSKRLGARFFEAFERHYLISSASIDALGGCWIRVR